jgi:hypothetical protein
MIKIDTKIPITDDPNLIQQKALELQNYIGEIDYYCNAAYYMLQCVDAELSRLRDQSLLDADSDENYKAKAAPIKVAYGKTHFKYHVFIKSPLKDDDFLSDIEGDFSYLDLKQIYNLTEYKYNRVKSKLTEVTSALFTCNGFSKRIF